MTGGAAAILATLGAVLTTVGEGAGLLSMIIAATSPPKASSASKESIQGQQSHSEDELD